MTESGELRLKYGVDDRPPAGELLAYGAQWALLLLPIVAISASIGADALEIDGAARTLFFQKLLLVAGIGTAAQALAGHRYPLQEGPAAAVLLALAALAPRGLGAIEGGMIVGGGLLALLGWLGVWRRLQFFFTPNVVAAIMLLIAFTFLPYLVPRMTGASAARPEGDVATLGLAFLIATAIVVLSERSRGTVRALSLAIGMAGGTALFWALGRTEASTAASAAWAALPLPLLAERPRFDIPAVLTMSLAYLAVAVNSAGSVAAADEVVAAGARDRRRLDRAAVVSGVAGVVSGIVGTIGTVSFSGGIGILLVTRVASRWPLVACGAAVAALGFLPKVAGALASIPPPVVGAALGVALASQVGAAIRIASRDGAATPRDLLVVGLATLAGTGLAFAPPDLFASLPPALGATLSNGLVTGILLAIALEHILLRQKKIHADGPDRRDL